MTTVPWGYTLGRQARIYGVEQGEGGKLAAAQLHISRLGDGPRHESAGDTRLHRGRSEGRPTRMRKASRRGDTGGAAAADGRARQPTGEPSAVRVGR